VLKKLTAVLPHAHDQPDQPFLSLLLLLLALDRRSIGRARVPGPRAAELQSRAQRPPSQGDSNS